jgi:hypothetical protein
MRSSKNSFSRDNPCSENEPYRDKNIATTPTIKREKLTKFDTLPSLK